MAENKVIQLQKQILELTKAINENGTATKRQAKELEKLEKQYEQLGGKLMPQYRKRHDEVNEALKKSKKFTQEATKANQTFTGKLQTAIGTLTRYGLAYKIINAAQQVFASLTTGAVKESIAFEKSLGNLAAVAGVSSKDVGKFGENALEVAGKTKFTANEIVGLQTELSKLGFSATDVIKSTEQIAFAAQALGAPLNETASLIGKVRNQFGLLVEQTGEISDTLVTSINNSALSFETFGVAIQYVGPIANTLGLTLQQTTGAMAALADAGFTASRIGTGLRGIFTELGKTSADVEVSLKKLANQNISLGEAVELVGKRNAAQLLTLLKNIDAIEEGNKKYYQQGRALIAASEQANTLSGQMEILNSEFKKFQIGIGDAIVQSDLFISVLGLISTEAQRTSYGFKILSEVGLEKYTSDVEKALDVSNDYDIVLRRLLYSGQITSTEFQKLSNNLKGYVDRTGAGLEQITKMVGEQGSAVFGEARDKFVAYARLLTEGIEKAKEQAAITDGQAMANQRYGKSVDEIIQKSLKGNIVNEEASEVGTRIQKTIDTLSNSLKNNTSITENQRTKYEAYIQTLQKFREQLINTYTSEEDLLKEKTKLQSEAYKLELDTIKRNTKEIINDINERAKIETELAKTAEERADIEAERTQLVSDAYKKQASEIRDLSKEFDTQIDKIELAAAASDTLSEILTSDVIKDVKDAVADYSKEIEKLDADLKANKITQEEYNEARDAQYDGLLNNIEAFKSLVDISPEVAAYFDEIAKKALEAGYAITESSEATKTVKKDFDDLLEDLKEGGWADYALQAVDALGEGLSEFNDTSLANTLATEEAKLDAIEARYKTEEDILKSQLNNQLITESQFRQKQKELRKAQIAEENSVERNIFNAKKKQDKNNALLEGLEAAAQAYIEAYKNYEPLVAAPLAGSIGAAIAGFQTTLQISAINKRNYVDKKFADGGMVNGPSHSEGGVPFSVQGQGGYEMEGGEYIVNKRATSMYRGLLEQINSSVKPVNYSTPFKFANGGVVNNISNVVQNRDESVDYLKAIAEATTSTAIGVSKPVRAYVADKDLRGNATERRIRDRNDRI
jgi:hypothetical protein